jgi:hypothetical protein
MSMPAASISFKQSATVLPSLFAPVMSVVV